MEAASTPCSSYCKWLRTARPSRASKVQKLREASKKTPITSLSRQLASLKDTPIEVTALVQNVINNEIDDSETVLYLGYGSNMSAETFRGKRKINPISQVNVVVPALSLTFDLPGIPYTEPCFGNVRYREQEEKQKYHESTDYHKDRWKKGLVGIVYEVTKADYAHIIATEGGGSGYQDVVVDCYQLADDPTQEIPNSPSGPSFRAHTLFGPGGDSRPVHSYAQPSPRYLKLITDGATEHVLPYEYQNFLNQIRTFHITTKSQKIGQAIFLTFWGPIFALIFGGASAVFLRPDGTYPAWIAAIFRAIFLTCWASYDNFFKKYFGDGERTIGDSDENDISNENEKQPLIRNTNRLYGQHCRKQSV